MRTTATYSREQYELVKDSRRVLLDYCKTIAPADFLAENSSFGHGGSMRNLLVHIANTYQYWIDHISLRRTMCFFEYESNKVVDDAIRLFDLVDESMHDFTDSMESGEWEIPFEINGIRRTAKPLQLFTHVITHEFHHKGQVLSVSRHLGYVPIDTDIMR